MAKSVIERLLAVEWRPVGGNDKHSRSRFELMREHLRRTALWAEHLGADTWPYPPLARTFDHTVGIPVDVREQLVEHLEDRTFYAHTSMLCMHTVAWAYLKEQCTSLPRLPDPYEPLLVLFERGGEFAVEVGQMARFRPWLLALQPRDEYLSQDPFVELDDATLDSLDEESAW
ncbi:hypothetical protein [Streptomyces huiliensis]|uniref:hypothetical protein n=1 Tax=Streptomyces huiliensis TaxID=2876027 RepID=UPI001CBB781E|nr:hypothetical protein [Streptomyces huiliensis]MBZ4319708.1 hypothetical protein [Streptomyces huiliensis]